MDGQAYLNKISGDTRPLKPAKKSLLQSKYFLFGIIAVGLFILIMIIGSLLGGNKSTDKTKLYSLKLHLDATEELIEEYQPSVKSSALRSSSSSLNTILENANSKLTTYLEEKYDYKEKNVDKKILAEAETNKTELNDALFEAKINGNLDRIYAHKMAYEISLFMNEEATIINKTNVSEVKTLFTSSYESLEKLYDNFNDFSETNN